MSDNLTVLESTDLEARPVRTLEIGGIHHPVYILADADGVPLNSLHGALDVHDAHVHSVPINDLFHRHTGVVTELSADVAAGEKTVQVLDGSSFANKDPFQLSNGIIETTFPQIVSGGGTNTFILDRPLDNSFSTGNPVQQVTTNMAVDGSVTPVSFKLVADLEQEWHIVSFLMMMIHATESDGTMFGGLSALQNGCVIRGFDATSGLYRTMAVWKTNADIALSMGEVRYNDKVGGGKWGVVGDGKIFERTGAVPKLKGSLVNDGSFLECLVQDDLREADSIIQLKGQGHIEGM